MTAPAPALAPSLGPAPVPAPAGPLGEGVRELLAGTPHRDLDAALPFTLPATLPAGLRAALEELPADRGLLADLDAQRTFFTVQELAYRGLVGVDPDWNEHPAVAAVRMLLGDAVEAAIRDRVGPVEPLGEDDPVARLRTELDAVDSPSLSSHLAREGTVGHYRDLVRFRSLYHLREADPHSAALAWITGPAKSALAEIQNDEYGCGRGRRMHSTLFADTMRALDLDDSYGAHVEDAPAVVLAWSNAMTLFASRRRLRGALVGHLAALESTSSLPNRRYADGLERLGFGPEASLYFSEHVEADAVHEQVALHGMVAPLVRAEPGLMPDVVVGFRAALHLDADVGRHLMAAWEAGRTGCDGPLTGPTIGS